MADDLHEDQHYSGDEIQQLLQKAIFTLPQKQQLVFNMKYFDEMKYSEMSEILETSVGALKASYFHAVKKVEKFLKSH
jgi:RNA polymerase sigma-70 factor (ECF subfamily)